MPNQIAQTLAAARIKKINDTVRELESSEEVMSVIHGLIKYLAEAHEACGDWTLEDATAHLISAWSALEKRSGR